MKRVLIKVAYDGTGYCGWQVQPNGVTIEEMLNRHLGELLGEDIKVTGASRTDSGVHALGNYAVFDTESRIPADKICFAMNQRLPEDIRLLDSCEVSPDFHPRKVKCHKTYEYKILHAPHENPIYRLYTHHLYRRLDLDAMRRAAEYLVGEHDFASFCSVNSQALTSVRRIRSIVIEKDEETSILTIRVTGDGFLYNMVRIIVGTLIEVGEGKYPPGKMEEILSACDRSAAGPTAPAKGLTLKEIVFDENHIDTQG